MKTNEIIKNIRKKNNLTQKELANILGVTYQAVSKWETGKNIPDITILCLISEKFNIDLEELLLGKKKQKTNKITISLILALIIISIVIMFSLSKRPYEFIGLSSNNENFEVEGIIAFSKHKSSVYISNIKPKYNDNEKYVKVEVVLYELNGNKHFQIRAINSDLMEYSNLTNLLKEINFKVEDFSRMCKKFENESLYLEINAISVENKTINYKIPLILDSDCNLIGN